MRSPFTRIGTDQWHVASLAECSAKSAPATDSFEIVAATQLFNGSVALLCFACLLLLLKLLPLLLQSGVGQRRNANDAAANVSPVETLST
jgi:hypothetical protein